MDKTKRYKRVVYGLIKNGWNNKLLASDQTWLDAMCVSAFAFIFDFPSPIPLLCFPADCHRTRHELMVLCSRSMKCGSVRAITRDNSNPSKPRPSRSRVIPALAQRERKRKVFTHACWKPGRPCGKRQREVI